MCLLVVDKNKKILSLKRKQTLREAVVEYTHFSDKPKLVYKYFEIVIDDKGFLCMKTPYRGFEVSMYGDVITRKGDFGLRKTIINDIIIEGGIHGYSKKIVWNSPFQKLHDYVCLECYIPPHIPFVYGQAYDIVSMQLIVPPVSKYQIKKFYKK